MTPGELAAIANRVDALAKLNGTTPGDAYRAGRLDEILLAGTGRGDAFAASLDWLADQLHTASEAKVANGMTGDPLSEWGSALVLRDMETIARRLARRVTDDAPRAEPTEGRRT